jgi:hypothetical protein
MFVIVNMPRNVCHSEHSDESPYLCRHDVLHAATFPAPSFRIALLLMEAVSLKGTDLSVP